MCNKKVTGEINPPSLLLWGVFMGAFFRMDFWLLFPFIMEELYYGNMFQVVFNDDKLIPRVSYSVDSPISIVKTDEVQDDSALSTNIGGFEVVVEDDEEIVETVEDPVAASYIPSQIPRRIKQAPNVVMYPSTSGGCGCNKK